MRTDWLLLLVLLGLGSVGACGRTAPDLTRLDGSSTTELPTAGGRDAGGGMGGTSMRPGYGGSAATGGVTTIGGGPRAGGVGGTGGPPPAGGTATTGGARASGGATATGGAVTTGGRSEGGAGAESGAAGFVGRGGTTGPGGAGAESGAAGFVARGGTTRPGGAAGTPCTPTTTEFVVDTDLPFDTTVSNLLVRGNELILLALTGAPPGARLYRMGFDGSRLGVVDLPGGSTSQLLAAEPVFILVHAGARQLELRQLDASGAVTSELAVDLEVEAQTDVWVAPAVAGNVLGVLYLVRSAEPIGNHGIMQLTTFALDGTRIADRPLMDEPAIVAPRALTPTPNGWAATWALIEATAETRRVLLSEIDQALSSSVTQQLAAFQQGLQGGFPLVPLVADNDGSITASWLDTRDEFDAPDRLYLWRRGADGIETNWSKQLTRRSSQVPDLASRGASVAVVVETSGPEEADEVHQFAATEPTTVDIYDAPDVRDRYRNLEWIAGGYAVAGAEAPIGGTATIKLALRRCD